MELSSVQKQWQGSGPLLRHAREALEHYRRSMKEQRDFDQRRHEQQLQAELRQAQQTIIVKQEDITRLNQDGALLVSELSHLQKALYDEQTSNRRLAQQLDALPAAQQRVAILEMQLADKDTQSNEMKQQISGLREGLDARDATVHSLELALASTQAKPEAQHAILSRWRIQGQSLEMPTGTENYLPWAS